MWGVFFGQLCKLWGVTLLTNMQNARCDFLATLIVKVLTSGMQFVRMVNVYNILHVLCFFIVIFRTYKDILHEVVSPSSVLVMALPLPYYIIVLGRFIGKFIFLTVKTWKPSFNILQGGLKCQQLTN